MIDGFVRDIECGIVYSAAEHLATSVAAAAFKAAGELAKFASAYVEARDVVQTKRLDIKVDLGAATEQCETSYPTLLAALLTGFAIFAALAVWL